MTTIASTLDQFPYVRPHGSGWQVRVRPFPEDVYRSLPEALQEVGTRLELREQGIRHLPRRSEDSSGLLVLGTAAQKFLDRKTATGDLSPAGVKHYTYATRPWRELDVAKGAVLDARGIPFAARPVVSLAAFELDDALVARARTNATSARNERQGLIASLRYAQKLGAQVDPAIFELDPIVARRVRVTQALTAEQLDVLIGATPRRARNLVDFCGTSGLRSVEAFTLTDDRVDVEARTVTVPAAIAKERRDKVIPLDRHEAAVIAAALLERPRGTRVVFARAEGGVWTGGKFRDRIWLPARRLAAARWRELYDLAEGDPTPFDSFTVHGLRHTAATLMRRSGMSPELIAARLGHSDGGALVLSLYSHAGTEQQVRAELDRIGSVREAAAVPSVEVEEQEDVA